MGHARALAGRESLQALSPHGHLLWMLEPRNISVEHDPRVS